MYDETAYCAIAQGRVDYNEALGASAHLGVTVVWLGVTVRFCWALSAMALSACSPQEMRGYTGLIRAAVLFEGPQSGLRSVRGSPKDMPLTCFRSFVRPESLRAHAR
jgi:hypothetical protein